MIPDAATARNGGVNEYEASAKRRQIMDGAREVFLAQGFDAASMGEIAHKARVSKGTLYVYFASKEEMVLGEMLQDKDADQSTRMKQAMPGRSSSVSPL